MRTTLVKGGRIISEMSYSIQIHTLHYIPHRAVFGKLEIPTVESLTWKEEKNIKLVNSKQHFILQDFKCVTGYDPNGTLTPSQQYCY